MAGGLHYPQPPPPRGGCTSVSGGYLNCLGKRGSIKAPIKGPLIKAVVVSLYLEWCRANSEQSGTRHGHSAHESGPVGARLISDSRKIRPLLLKPQEHCKARKKVFSLKVRGHPPIGLRVPKLNSNKRPCIRMCLELENLLIFQFTKWLFL